jgi:cell wall-associated NlpC family hydrolase
LLSTRHSIRTAISFGIFASICCTALFGHSQVVNAEEPAATPPAIAEELAPAASPIAEQSSPVQEVTAQEPTPTQAEKIISTGTKFMGVKYRFGAPSGITYAFDCSSFTQYIFKKHGIVLPRTSSQQSTKGTKIAKKDLAVGDLVFFKDPGRSGKIGHVAVYAGDNMILHTGGKGGVKFSKLTSPYYTKYYVTARRVVVSNS